MTDIDNNNKNPLIGYTPSLQESISPSSSSKNTDIEQQERTVEEKTPENKTVDKIMEVVRENIKTLFKDQYGEAFAKIFVKDHDEIISVSSKKFARFLLKIFYEKYGVPVKPESVNSFVQTLQAQAEFGDLKYDLTLRVAEYNEDLYYDLTNEKHQCVKISSNGTWEVLDRTPIPLFKRYIQVPQVLPSQISTADGNEDPLEEFFSTLTNIKNKEDRLILKVALITWFIPNIPHFVLLIHGGKGSAKSMFLNLIKSIVDPAKPLLFTIHSEMPEFIQQLSHNYMSAYDNLKHIPKWLSDEVCKAVTGIGQTKRVLYTVDEDKVFEYKHCLMFNGINIAFTESDIIERSIVIELSEIKPENRKTEEEILQEFDKLKPKVLKYIFDVLSKAITLKKDIKINGSPRMADSTIWGEAIARGMGYKENEFLTAYCNNIKFQNAEVIDSHPVAFAIKKLVEKSDLEDRSDNSTLFEGSPLELLQRLNEIATEHRINTHSNEWPKDHRWTIRRINTVKSNLQQELGITIDIKRITATNTSIIKIDKNDSGISGEHNISPENESLSPYLEGLSPALQGLSPAEIDDLSTKSNETGDSGHTGDKFDILLEKEGKNEDNSKETPSSNMDELIGYKAPFYYCKEHPKFENIHKEEVIDHIHHHKERDLKSIEIQGV